MKLEIAMRETPLLSLFPQEPCRTIEMPTFFRFGHVCAALERTGITYKFPCMKTQINSNQFKLSSFNFGTQQTFTGPNDIETCLTSALLDVFVNQTGNDEPIAQKPSLKLSSKSMLKLN
ncbi:unnamed protein product [Dovyalis caffra]|uniref:Uncharacterized protein n=1 Tax=Dovyalis caffra TaxID=77055 RepID=A0AAV1RKA3_9ROSI|nr:unnamed protein product [Dovyalis caffra]